MYRLALKNWNLYKEYVLRGQYYTNREVLNNEINRIININAGIKPNYDTRNFIVLLKMARKRKYYDIYRRPGYQDNTLSGFLKYIYRTGGKYKNLARRLNRRIKKAI